jgi:hypothetical protein
MLRAIKGSIIRPLPSDLPAQTFKVEKRPEYVAFLLDEAEFRKTKGIMRHHGTVFLLDQGHDWFFDEKANTIRVYMDQENPLPVLVGYKVKRTELQNHPIVIDGDRFIDDFTPSKELKSLEAEWSRNTSLWFSTDIVVKAVVTTLFGRPVSTGKIDSVLFPHKKICKKRIKSSGTLENCVETIHSAVAELDIEYMSVPEINFSSNKGKFRAEVVIEYITR